MAQSNELKIIKKIYGESLMKLCRKLFPTILEEEGKITEILNSTFANNSRTLGEDITKNHLEDQFKNLVYSKLGKENEYTNDCDKSPYELLDEAGYQLYECLTENDIQSFKKYYETTEELCTFDGGRLEKCFVFFAVKKNVDEIKRENFKDPEREDEYGTSVMSIQFNKTGVCTVSIKNRYNHRVSNPDATYGNDLNAIIPGLTESFKKMLKQRGLELNSLNVEKMQIPNYVIASDGKYYKYNCEVYGTYYCPGNIIIDYMVPKKIENSESQLLIDYFILNMEKKTLRTYDACLVDCFVAEFENIKKISVTKNKENKKITINVAGKEKPILIEIDKDNQIIRIY